MKRVLSLIAICIFLSVTPQSPAVISTTSDGFYPVPEPSSPLVNHTVISTYMTEWNVDFYDSENEHGKIPDHASFIPILNDYMSGDSYQYDWQIYWAASAGINTFVFDCGWYTHSTEPYLAISKSLTDSIYSDKINFTITYHLGQSFWDKVGTPSLNLTERVLYDFDAYIDDFLWRENLLRHNGEPVIHIMLPWNIPSWTNDVTDPTLVEVIDGIRDLFQEQMDTDVLLIADLTWPSESGNLLTACDGIFDGCFKPGGMVFLWDEYGWDDMHCQYDEMFYWDNLTSAEFHTTFSSSDQSFVPSFSPGFNNTKIQDATWLNEKLVIIERDLAAFQSTVGIMEQYIDTPLDMLYLHSWNDFQEGTCLEPCEEYGTDYLDAIRNGLTGQDQTSLIYTPESYATYWIEEATSALESNRDLKDIESVLETEEILEQATTDFDSENYMNATILAHEAYVLITNAPDMMPTTLLSDVVIIVSVIGVVVIVTGIIAYRKR
ncbi:MAG: glycoside hydrolase family 99-like domain-containing protein [Candidatus Thorarchaeota archaeon]